MYYADFKIEPASGYIEIGLLGNQAIAVSVTVFDDGRHTPL